ncbi:hypothetical protein C8J57DRAFT_1069652, partial [Mycena rebaudengoi]
HVLRFPCDDRVTRCRLRGIIYHKDDHFTSRLFTPSGDIWFHDGITTWRSTRYEGNLRNIGSRDALHSWDGARATLAVYAVDV